MTEAEAFCCLSAAVRLLGTYTPKKDFEYSCNAAYANAESALRVLAIVPTEFEAQRVPPTICVKWPQDPSSSMPDKAVVKLATDWWEARRAKDFKKASTLKRQLKGLGFSTEDVAPAYRLVPEIPCVSTSTAQPTASPPSTAP